MYLRTALLLLLFFFPRSAFAQLPFSDFADVTEPIGIAWNDAIGKLIVSSGHPVTQALVAIDPEGVVTPLAANLGFFDETKVAVSPGLGGFTAGDIFTGGGVGQIARFSANGTMIANPWVVLPGATGPLRGGLAFDEVGTFGHNMIAVTNKGEVYRVTSSGVATLLANLKVFAEGVTVAPLSFGPAGGHIIVGRSGTGDVVAISPSGEVTVVVGGFRSKAIEDLDFVPDHGSLFLNDFGVNKIRVIDASQFINKTGTLLVTLELEGEIVEVTFDPVRDTYTVAPLAAGFAHLEHVTFAPVFRNRPPKCRKARPALSEIWPPNHRFVGLPIEGVTDPDGDVVTVTILSVTQDEPVLLMGGGFGPTCPDGRGIGTGMAFIRAERSGKPSLPGNGRVYKISFLASDGKGGMCTGSVAVCVPHDLRPGHVCIDDGQSFDSTQCAEKPRGRSRKR